ncbi:hypothetical protein [Oceanicoccus sp. KOV_DT_Chl]|uniref:hypothetical protein n=1 Tax=Oceanicoccus sp. KOV_DT_Chl TaxID=1904639 RepID=UPI000C7B19AE|nr:hypothetical protein [Oceanicoccus sp. KOV_DT_Chl]
MPVMTARWFLAVSLIVLLPMPFYFEGWYSSTVLFVMAFSTFSWLLVAQGIIAVLVIAGIAYAYGLLSAMWPAKIRGSIMGLAVLTALIVFSSLPIYHDLASRDGTTISFLELYQ